MHGIGYGDFEMRTDSFAWSRQMSRPSTDSSTGDRARGEIWKGSAGTSPEGKGVRIHAMKRERDGERAVSDGRRAKSETRRVTSEKRRVTSEKRRVTSGKTRDA
jgi:hypothetical protein